MRGRLLLLSVFLTFSVLAEEPRIHLVDEPGELHGTIEIVGLDSARLDALRRVGLDAAGWRELFTVRVGEALAEDLPAMLGDYAAEAGVLRFTPRFPLLAGQPYTVRFRDPTNGQALDAIVALPRPDIEPTTTVTAIYPSADVLPENLLRLYIHFSAPMSRGEAFEHLLLIDEMGEEVEFPFVAPEHELWNPAGDRLTLFFDPGRIKRGVGPHLEHGPPLEAGRVYRLLIDPAWRDARGQPLAAGHQKLFRTKAADRRSPRAADWRLVAPHADREALEIVFPEPLDRALLQRLLTVLDADGEPVEGTIEIVDLERRFRYRPAASWRAGDYRVRVGTELEDVAGNSLRRPFESALGAQPEDGGPAAVYLSFTVADD